MRGLILELHADTLNNVYREDSSSLFRSIHRNDNLKLFKFLIEDLSLTEFFETTFGCKIDNLTLESIYTDLERRLSSL